MTVRELLLDLETHVGDGNHETEVEQ